MTTTNTYSPDGVVGDFDGGDFTQGLAKGVAIEITRNADDVSMSVGTTGDVTFVESMDKTGKVVVTLKQGSAANDMFSAKATLKSKGPLLLKYLGGSLTVHSQNARISKPADVQLGNEDTERKWEILCADIEILGGSFN